MLKGLVLQRVQMRRTEGKRVVRGLWSRAEHGSQGLRFDFGELNICTTNFDIPFGASPAHIGFVALSPLGGALLALPHLGCIIL